MSDAIDEKLDKMIDPLSDISDKLDDVTNELIAIKRPGRLSRVER